MRIIKDKRGKMMWYLLALILGIAVVFAMIYFIFIGNKTNWQFLKDLPVQYTDKDKLLGLDDLSEEELKALNCNPIGEMYLTNENAFSSGSFYFKIGNQNTKLYLDEKNFEIKLDNPGIFTNIPIGKIENGVIKIDEEFLKKKNKGYQKYSENLPSINELRNLHNSYQLQGGKVWCKSFEETVFKDLESCIESCILYDGTCKSSGSSNEVSLGKIDCKTGSCYVPLTKEKLSDGEMKLDKFLIRDLENNFDDLENNFQEITLIPGSSGILLVYEVSGSDFFCSTIRTNNEILEKDSFTQAIKSNFVFQPSDEKTFELIAWNPTNKLKVFKRIKINLEKPNKYFQEGDFIKNINFKKEVNSNNFKTNDVFYVILEKIINFEKSKNFPGPEFLRYKIQKISDNEINIEGFYFKNDDGSSFGGTDTEQRWHQLDCNNGFTDTINFFSNTLSIKIKDISSTLSATVSENCKIIK